MKRRRSRRPRGHSAEAVRLLDLIEGRRLNGGIVSEEGVILDDNGNICAGDSDRFGADPDLDGIDFDH